MGDANWLEDIAVANGAFLQDASVASLPVARSAGKYGIVTCMDPRVNLAALGVPEFAPDGGGRSTIRVVRTMGGRAEERSLFLAVHLTGIDEWAIVTHTDCGAAAAWSKTGVLAESLERRLGPDAEPARAWAGEPLEQGLRERLMLFTDPRAAAREEVARVRALPFVPADVIVHGLCYDVATGKVEVVVDGYGAGAEAS